MHSNRMLAFIAFVLLASILACNAPVALAPQSRNAPILSQDAGPTLLKPAEFVTRSQGLVQAVADLNLAQMAFIKDAASPAPAAPRLDGDLVQIAVVSMQVAQIAELLGQTAIAQVARRSETTGQIADLSGMTGLAETSQNQAAGQLASQYFDLARFGYTLEIETQNTRAALASGDLTPARAASRMAEYGARLWNPAVDKPGTDTNPFAPFVSNPDLAPNPVLVTGGNLSNLINQAGGPPLSWLAVTNDKVNSTLTIPAPTAASAAAEGVSYLNNPVDPSNGNLSQQAALNQLVLLGAQATPPAGDGSRLVSVSLPKSEIMAEGNNPGRNNLPAFPGGAVQILVQPTDGSDPLDSLISLGAGETPQVAGQTPIRDAQPLVIITISDIVVDNVTKPTSSTSSFEGIAHYHFKAGWNTSLVNPRFHLVCSGGNQLEVSTASGFQTYSVEAPLILYPGSATAYCYASTFEGTSVGGASVNFLVGDAGGATQRANQVETESVALGLTLTSDMVNSANATLTSVAGTQQVLLTQNSLETEVAAQQTQEFAATITAIARLTAQALPPPATDTPQPTATFTPQLVESFAFPGNLMAMSTKTMLQRGRLYRVCMSGFAYTTTGAWSADQIMHINGAKVPPSGCLTFEGSNSTTAITCGGNGQDLGEPAENPGAYEVTVYDLGPWP